MTLAAIDFLRKSPQPWVGWVLLAFGIVALGSAMWIERQWASARRDALRLQQVSSAARQIKANPGPPPAATLAQRRSLQAQTELRRPWLPMLQAVESATADPVYLLSLNVEPATGLIKLEAEAPSFDDAVAYVQKLGESSALQPPELLSHAETPSPRADRPLVKFSVAVHWNVR